MKRVAGHSTAVRRGRGIAALLMTCLFCAGALERGALAEEVKRFELTIAERALAAGDETLRVEEGDAVELVWLSDEDVELHLHGYDVEVAVAASKPAVMAVTATVAGRFPISSHGFGGEHGGKEEVLAYLEVYPN